jgi:hypothetical protein
MCLPPQVARLEQKPRFLLDACVAGHEVHTTLAISVADST